MRHSIGLSKVAILVVAVLTTSVFVSSAYCQDNYFTGATSNDWDDATNWSLGTLPNNMGGLTEVGTAFPPMGGSTTTATANITGMLTTDTIGEFRVARGNGTTGVVNHSSGTLNTSGWSFVGVDASDAMDASMGTYNLSGDGVLSGGDAWFLGLGGAAAANTGVMTIADNSSATFGAFVVGANDGNTGMVTQTGGDVVYNSWMTIGESSGATGTYDMSGGTLTQNSGELTIGQQDGGNGTLNISGTAAVALNGNGVILGRNAGGEGRLEITGSNAAFNTTNLLVGISDGFNAGAGDPTGTGTLSFIADAGGVTAINASGDVSLNDGTVLGSSILELDLAAAPAGDILLVSVGGTLTGQFAGLAEGASVGFGRTITYTFGDGNDIGLIATAIPEPGTAAVLLAASFGMVIRRRRS